MNLQEAKEKIYDWRIHLDVPMGTAADFQLRKEDDQEIAEMIETHLQENTIDDEEFWDENEDDVCGVDDGEDLGAEELLSDIMDKLGVDEEEGELDLSSFLPKDIKKMAKEQEKIKKTAPKTIIHYESKPREIGLYVFEGDMFVVTAGMDIAIGDLPENIQDKICEAIERA